MARADNPWWIIGPLACVGLDVSLDSDSLEGAQGLPHDLDFAFVGSLVTDRLPEQAGDRADSSECLAKVGPEAFEVVDGCFDGRFVGFGSNGCLALASVSGNRMGSIDAGTRGPVCGCCCHWLLWVGFGLLDFTSDRHDHHLATFVPEMQGGGRVGETDGCQAEVERFGEVVTVHADRDVRSDGRGSGERCARISRRVLEGHDTPLVDEEDAFVFVGACREAFQQFGECTVLRKRDVGLP